MHTEHEVRLPTKCAGQPGLPTGPRAEFRRHFPLAGQLLGSVWTDRLLPPRGALDN